jgi:hypothetical protein
MNLQKLAAVGLALLPALSGCPSTPTRFLQLDQNTGAPVATDAKVRTILTLNRNNTELASRDQKVICAEPSPDVAQAVSEALTASLQVDLQNAKGSSGSLGGNLNRTSSESVAELGERLATIQLLRDKMYRACEAYGNGAIGSTAYALILARHDKTMMSLLSNELAAAAFGRSLASINASSSISGSSDPAALKAQQADVKQKASAVQQDLDAKKDATADYKALMDALGVLMALDLQSVNSSAGTSSTGVPGATGGARAPDIQSIAEIHRNYIDDDGIDPLTDACIIGMEALDEHQSFDDRQNSREAMNQYRKQRSDLLLQLTTAQREQTDALYNVAKSSAEVNVLLAKKQRSLKGILSDEDERNLEKATQEVSAQQAYAASQASLIAQTQQALADKGDPLQDLFLSKGSPFAAFCYESALNGESKYVQVRLSQKKDLRILDPTTNEISARRLDLCAKALDTPIDAGYTAEVKQKTITAQCGSTAPQQPPAAGSSTLGAPTNLVATSSSGKITVKFDPPKSGVPTGYTATATNTNAAKDEKPLDGTGGAASKSISISGCSDSETYSVEVQVKDASANTATAKVAAPVKCSAAAVPPPKPALPSPKNVAATSNAGNIVVTFEPVMVTGVTGYSATATNTAAGTTDKPLTGKGDATSKSITIDGCSGGVTYAVAVEVAAAAGNSAPGKAKNPVKCVASPSKPQPPTITKVSSAGSSILVAFSPSKQDGGSPIIAYSATATNTNSKKGEKPLTDLVNTTKTSVSIPNCTTGDSYSVEMVAKNKIGDSEPSKASGTIECAK